jgi:hypothetical protein
MVDERKGKDPKRPCIVEEAGFARAAFLAYRGLVDEQQGGSARLP